jgi:Tol biopolymer transport system component
VGGDPRRAPADEPHALPELHDNFHAYWSPDGRYIAWTALSWNPADGGTGRSEVRVGRFEARGPRGPRLVDVHVVRPPNGHWYETQWWAPDGSGFLYTETYDTALNPELFFCRLADPARGPCRPQRLTRNAAWDEQAIFTPDMRSVVFMSTRGHPGAFENWARLATLVDLPATYDYAIILPVFNRSFLDPVFAQADDLYVLPLRWTGQRSSVRPGGPPRRLTRSGDRGWVIPEFAWDPSGRRLLWTQTRLRGRVDERSVLRRIRERIIRQLSGAPGVGGPPASIFDDVAEQVGEVLRNPSAFAPAGQAPRARDTRTVIGRLR